MCACVHVRVCPRLTGAASATVEDLRTQTRAGFQNAIKSKKVPRSNLLTYLSFILGKEAQSQSP